MGFLRAAKSFCNLPAGVVGYFSSWTGCEFCPARILPAGLRNNMDALPHRLWHLWMDALAQYLNL